MTSFEDNQCYFISCKVYVLKMISMEIKKMCDHNVSFIYSSIFLISMENILMNWHAYSHGGIFVTLRGYVKLMQVICYCL